MRFRNVRKSAKGFTLIELLIVVAIIGILASLILPGVIGARRAARRAQCLSNMSNIGKALMQFVARDRRYPHSGFWDPVDPAGADANTNGHLEATELAASWSNSGNAGLRYSWCVELLPFLEQENLYNTWDFTGQANDSTNPQRDGTWGSYMDGSTARSPATNGTATNATLSVPAGSPSLANDGGDRGNWQLCQMTEIKVFTCPADITGVDNRGNMSYVVNGGFSSHWLIDVNASSVIAPFATTESNRRYREDLFRMGLMFLGTRAMPSDANRRHSPDSVRDGISQTIAIAENMNSGYVDPSFAVRQFPTNWGCPHPDITSFRVDSQVVAPGGAPAEAAPGFDYNMANDSSRNTSINGDVTGVNDNLHPYPNSFHTTGVNVLMCDGSARFIAQNIGGEIWAKLVSPDGGRLVRPVDGVVGGAAMENISPTTNPNWGFTQLPLTEAIFD